MHLYTPDLMPSDYHVFELFQKDLKEDLDCGKHMKNVLLTN